MSTFVLIHGAYQGGWIWKLVAERLRAKAHTVFTPSLDGCGERADQIRPGITTETHAGEISRLLHYFDLDDVTLVGTSSGGMVMTRVAEQTDKRIARLVFADTLALMSGEKVRDIVTRPATINTELSLGPSREDAEQRLLVDLEPGLREWTAERFTLHPQAVFNEPVVLDDFWERTWDASVVYCSRAANPGEAHLKRTADRLGAKWHVMDTGHYPMLSAPDELSTIIMNG